MHETALIVSVLFVSFLLLLTTLLKNLSRRTEFPYTISLLIVGFLTQFAVRALGIEIHFNISPNFTFFVLLPLLLFESANNINPHQFKLQFRTITFLATFGLLASIGIVGILLAWLLGLPLGVSLLFGAIISATDPIAVLALFKSLGAPKRLAMLAEGESMFNDATAVIVFRVIAAIVIANQTLTPNTVVHNVATFFYVFIGSLLIGTLMGWLTSTFIEQVKNDPIIETTLTVALALSSFAISEHYLHLSGVIATVAAGITLSTIGKTRISSQVLEFMHEIWEYIGFFAVSLVFFFAAYLLDFSALWRHPVELLVVIGSVIVARALSVYGSFFITNKFPFFNQEPNVPTSWQHVINWGGLRGVIPLVLVYSLPETFAFRELLISYTLFTFVYSLIVHGLSIRSVLTYLKLHIPSKTERIMQEESNLLEIEDSLKKLQEIGQDEFDPDSKKQLKQMLMMEAKKHERKLLSLANPEELYVSLKLQTLQIERNHLQTLFKQGHITEATVLEFEGELDLQQDALEYPEVFAGRGFTGGGKINPRLSFRKQLSQLRKILTEYPALSKIIRSSKQQVITSRLQLLKARILCSEEVVRYLNHIRHLFKENKQALEVIDKVKAEQLKLKRDNGDELQAIFNDYPQMTDRYQNTLLKKLVLQ